MIYSGTDLIRTSGQSQERMERLRPSELSVSSVAAVQAKGNATSLLDNETHNALLRFARFLNKEGSDKEGAKKEKRERLPQNKAIARNPYVSAEMHRAHIFGTGQFLDLIA